MFVLNGSRSLNSDGKKAVPRDAALKYLYICNYSPNHPSPCPHCVEVYLEILGLKSIIKSGKPRPPLNKVIRSAVAPSKIGQRHLIIFRKKDASLGMAKIPNLPFPSCKICMGQGIASSSKNKKPSKSGVRIFEELIAQKKISLNNTENNKLGYYCATSFINIDFSGNGSEAHDYSFGSSRTKIGAYKTSKYEAIERLFVFAKPQNRYKFKTKVSDLPHVAYIDPSEWNRKCCILDDGEAVRLPSSSKENARYRWYGCHDLMGNNVLAPEHVLFCNTWEKNDKLYLSSSGCAVAETLQKSKLRAALELIERDCALRSWVTGYSGHKVKNWFDYDAELSSLCKQCAHAGIKISVNELSDIPGVSVMIAILINQRNKWPACAIGTAARTHQPSALKHALREAILNYLLQIRRGKDHFHLPEYFDRPMKTHPMMHNHYYGHKRNVRHLEFWLSCKQSDILDDKDYFKTGKRNSLESFSNGTEKRFYFHSLEPEYLRSEGYFITRCVSPDMADLTFQTGAFWLPAKVNIYDIRNAAFKIPHPFC